MCRGCIHPLSPHIDALPLLQLPLPAFLFTSVCVLPRTFLISRLPVFIVSGSVSPPSQRPSFRFRMFPSPFARFFAMPRASFVLVTQTTTTEQAQSLLIFSEDRNIFQVFSRALKSPILCLLRRGFLRLQCSEKQRRSEIFLTSALLFIIHFSGLPMGQRLRRQSRTPKCRCGPSLPSRSSRRDR